ncbi:hypothetical protein K502DRAFT_324137 [Neoconidiobolus thromboides FSU 785]|nr:hypothetical protein K502DRAFT_324137 [Neoconidiobolus thromboides FSU 785]
MNSKSQSKILLDTTSIEETSNKNDKLFQNSIESLDLILEKLTRDRNAISQGEVVNFNESDIKILSSAADAVMHSGKDANTNVNKLYKEYNSKFMLDFNQIITEEGYEGKENLVLELISEYFIRQGYFEAARIFSHEAKIMYPSALKSKFNGLHTVLDQIRQRNLNPAIEWAKNNREFLDRKGSNLEFCLHRVNFTMLYQAGNFMEAMMYGQENFATFTNTHFNEIQKLMGMLSFSPQLKESPYYEFANTNQWPDIEYMFTRDFCSVLGISHESPLYITITVGTIAYPKMIKMLKYTKKTTGWSEIDELQAVAELLESWRFHSIFICPVDKVQASDDNPPMMMTCGHVISQGALHKIAKLKTTFKCPYCPNDSSITEVKRIYF